MSSNALAAESFLEINGVTFDLNVTRALYEKESRKNHLVLGKTQQLIDDLKNMTKDMIVDRIFEIGIYKGGSCALYNEMFQPEKLVAIDYMPKAEPALVDYIQDRQLEEKLKTYYGTDQSNQNCLREIYATEFGQQKLDLVIDDASHLYNQTKASFNTLFPLLRPGGLYVIEDWAWSHWPGDEWQNPHEYFRDKTPLSVLIFECVMANASSMGKLIKRVTVMHSVVYIERGEQEIGDDFDLGKSYLTQNKPWWPKQEKKKRFKFF